MTLPIAILAGGLATRLRPLTEKIPKALVDINGEPFIAHQLRLLNKAGLTDVVICAWYHGELIQEFVGDGSHFGLKVKYSFDGKNPLGTGGALLKALPYLGNIFFVLYGDSYLPCDYIAIENAYRSSQKKGLMTVYHNVNQGDISNVEFTDGQILIYDKRKSLPQMEYIDYGLGILNQSAFKPYPFGHPFDLAELYQYLLSTGQLAGYEVSERFYEVGSYKGIHEMEAYLNNRNKESY